MVPDENLLLNQQDVFKLLIDRGWSIVIPNSGSLALVPSAPCFAREEADFRSKY